jgi:hypothetical protein
MSKMKRNQPVKNLIEPLRKGKRCGFHGKDGIIYSLEFLSIPSSQCLDNLLLIGKELIERAG